MPTQAELDWDNTVSKNEQKATRERREKARAAKDKMRDELNAASSTKEKREIRARGKIHDINTTPENKEGTDERIANDGVDKVSTGKLAPSSGGGGLGDDTLVADYVDGSNTAQQATFVIVT